MIRMTNDKFEVAVAALDDLPDEELITKDLPIGDRMITVRALSNGQMMQLQHEANLLQKDSLPGDRKMKGVDRIYRILKSAIVEPDEREYVEDQMADGELDLRTLVRLIVSVYQEDRPKRGSQVRRSRSPRR